MKSKNDNLKLTNTGRVIAELPAPIQLVKNSAHSILIHSLESLFNSCDDLFFDLSSRATSNAEQNLYFESMRELRIKKAGAISTFSRLTDESFIDITRQARQETQPESKNESLSLVQDDDIEKDVAINSMTNKARANNQEALFHLQTRLDYLSKQLNINEDNNPLDPQQICKNFGEVCELFDIHIKAKIIIFKQFERIVVAMLGKVYATANDLLINEGVLPQITHTIQKSNSATPANTQEQSTAANTGQEANQAQVSQTAQFQELSNLLANIRQFGNTPVAGYNQYTANPGPQMSNPELISALSNLQAEPVPEHLQDGGANNLHAFVELILAKANPQQPQAVQQADEDTINLVAMFFDFILDDQNLPSAFQALISRMQIPVLKLALKDRSFFQNSGHPARKLINNIASAAIGWEAENPEKDKFYQFIAKVIQEIIENFGQDESIFANKLAAVDQAIEKYQHRQALIEKRTKQAEQGKAITTAAKSHTQKTILDLLKKTSVPVEISQFIIEHWQPHMTSTFIKHGKDSTQWLDATQLIHDLLWACQIQKDAKSVARLEKIKPVLLNRIDQGLSNTINDQQERLTLCQNINTTIQQLQNNEVGLTIRPITPAQAQELGHTPGSGSKNWKEMTALERQKAQHQALTYEFIQKAESLALDSWLDYEVLSEQKHIRCKLSARIEATDSFIFVNRFGFKVLERSRKDFAYDLQQKRAKILEATPLFDRAFSNISDNLRSLGQPSR